MLYCADYDAPTQLVKPRERNTRYVDAVMTVPKVRGGDSSKPQRFPHHYQWYKAYLYPTLDARVPCRERSTPCAA
jgi:hypothetical protein